LRTTFLAAILGGLLIGVVVAGVRLVTGGDAGPGSDATPSAGTPTPDPGSPEATAARFAEALSARDVSAIYALLDSGSGFDRTLADLETAYDNLFVETTTTGVDARVASASETAATLSVSLATAYFGNIEYSIAVPLTREDDEYRVGWSPALVYPGLADGQSFLSTIERPSRGAILDRNGAPLAITVDVRYIGLNRSLITDREAVTAALVEFGFTRETVDAAFESPLGPSQRVDVGVVADADAEVANELVRETRGLLLYFVANRTHPLGPAAAHVVGYTRELTADELTARAGTGVRIGDRIGATGLEATLEPVLAGNVGATLEIVDSGGATVRELSSRPFVDGQDITTTLDAAVLRAAHDRLGARRGAAVIIDPRSNAILALNSSPSFDPDAFERNDAAAIAAIFATEGDPLANRATMGLYSAGSTFKLVTAAAGLASGLYTTSSLIDCSAIWYGVDPPRRNWEGARGLLSLAQGLMRSCNPVFYEVALSLYNETDNYLSEVARLFGFGAPTGVVGLAEEDGLVPDAAWKRAARGEPWYPGDEVNLGIGQGDLLITPLQLANAYSTFIAGSLRVPIVLAGEEATVRGELPLTEAQVAHLWEGLRLVTSAGGTASAAFANAGYFDFAGKSGTAEDANEQQHVLFVAFTPASAPTGVAAIVLDDGQSGSVEAAPMARDILLAIP